MSLSKSPLESVRNLLAVQSLRDVTDEDLLQRFVTNQDEAAFRVIAERHGPMVLGVCQRALGCPHDAEDAFQSTFLVFARKADTIRKKGSLASWLHGVAMRVVTKLQRECARRHKREQTVARQPPRDAPAELSWAEVKIGLDEELQRLPDRYRDLLVLCYLEGKTRDEAAQQLGLTVGVLHGRLERGRKLLADRLSKRGLTISAGLLAVAVSPTSVVAAVRAGALFAARESVGDLIAPQVLSITNEVLKGMTMSKLKVVLGSLVCSAFLLSGVGFTFAQGETRPEALSFTRDVAQRAVGAATRDTDEAFIKRVSQDLRGVEPTPAEVHFFVLNQDPKKRATLIDLFVKEREAKKKAEQELAKRYIVQRAMFAHHIEDIRMQLQGTRQLEELYLDQARAKVKEKENQLKAARLMKYRDEERRAQEELRIKQLEVEVEKARFQLRVAELNLNVARQKAEKARTPPATTKPSGPSPK